MKRKGYERETIINYNEVDHRASVYTCNAALARKLATYTRERPDDCTLLRSDEDAVEYLVPKRWIRIRPPRAVSDEAKEAARQRMRDYQSTLKESAQRQA